MAVIMAALIESLVLHTLALMQVALGGRLP